MKIEMADCMYYLKYCDVVLKKSDSLQECFLYLKNSCRSLDSLSDYDLVCDVDKSYNIRLFIEDLPKILRKEF